MHREQVEKDQSIWAGTASRAADRSVVRNLLTSGYHVFPDVLPSHNWFARIYQCFDEIAEIVARNPLMLESWDAAVAKWHAENENKAFFCGVPPKFKDRAERKGKRNKAYIQYCLDFACSKSYANSPLGSVSAISELFRHMEDLHFRCLEVFAETLRAVCDGSEALGRFHKRGRLSPIIFKLLRYNPDERRFGSGPHYDKSALSALLHSDDDAPTYRVGPHRDQPFRYSELIAPIVYPSSREALNSAVVLCGACLQEVGLERFRPSPHSVKPIVGSKRRHSIVAFQLAPFLNTDGLVTKAQYINDFDQSVT
jgi:hypothetical protein